MRTDGPRAGRAAVRLACVAAVLALAFAGLAGCRGEARTFRIGYMICNSTAETRDRFAALTAYLSDATGARFEPVYLDTADVEDAFERGDLDFTHTNSLLYVILKARQGARLVAADRRGAFGVRTRGAIIARAGSGIETVADLAGKRFVFGPQWAPFGFLAPYALLLEGGVDPETDLGYYAIPHGSWKHEKAIYAVLYGAFDAGAAPLIDLEEMAADGKIAADDFVVLARSDPAPYCTVAAAPGVPASWVERVRDALLAAGPDTTAEVDGERLAVLKRALLTGFDAVSDADYDPVRAWARAARMPPYEEY